MGVWKSYIRQSDVEVQKHQSSPLFVLPIVALIAAATFLSNRYFIHSAALYVWVPVLLGTIAGVFSLISHYLPANNTNTVAVLQIFDTGLYGASAVFLGLIVPFPHNLIFWMLYILGSQVWARDSAGLVGFIRVIIIPALPLLFFPPPNIDVIILLAANIVFFLITAYSMIKVRELERRRWETEDMLVRMATMADHIKSQMQLANAANLGLVVHDLKNRIAPLSMVNEMLNEVFGNWKKDGSLNDLVFHDALELSDRAVTTLLTQTGDILRDVARVQVGGQSFSLFKLQQILGNLESGMVHEDRIEAMRKLTSVVEVSSFPEGEVPGNIDDLQLIFINIIQNAVAAGAKSVRIDSAFDSDGKNIEMTIANNGKPLTAAQKETLFHPFCSGKKGGTGVGLFFAKQWLESIGGDIVLRDSHEQKTVFAIIMPLKDDKTSKDNNAKQKTSGLYSSIKGTGKHTVPKGTGKHVSSKGTGKNASPGSTGERDSAKITAKQKKVSGEPF